jgi:hypothetical protein
MTMTELKLFTKNTEVGKGKEMNEMKRKSQEEADRLVAEFLSKGGTITQIPTGQRTEPSDAKTFWGGRPKKPASEEKNKE